MDHCLGCGGDGASGLPGGAMSPKEALDRIFQFGRVGDGVEFEPCWLGLEGSGVEAC